MSTNTPGPHPRADANRQNARRSTGPKNTSSTRFNALKHGLLAQGVTELDSPETFRDLCGRFEALLKPVGGLEQFLARQVILGILRLTRADRLEAEFVTEELNPAITETHGGWGVDLEGMGGRIVVVDPGLPARLPASKVDALANSFGRYATMIQNRLFRALHELERLQASRAGANAADPVKVDGAIQAAGLPVASFRNSA